MKVKITYDNGKEEEIELSKIEVIKNENNNKNYAHQYYQFW
jgi:hypothetical protein